MIDPHDEQRWDKNHSRHQKHELIPSLYAQEVEKLFPRGSIICELGGGAGADAVYFLKQGHYVVVLDISTVGLSIAKQLAVENKAEKNLQTRQIDFGHQNIPLKDQSTTVVYSRISLNYFPAKETIRIFSEVYRILKPGGMAFLTLKSPEDKEEMENLKEASLYEPEVYIDSGHLRSRYSISTLESLLKQSGIRNFNVKPHQEKPHLPSGRVLFVNEITFTKSH